MLYDKKNILTLLMKQWTSLNTLKREDQALTDADHENIS